MGAAESTPRKLTIPNESQLIKITDNLAERILACQDKKGAEEKAKEAKKSEKICPPSEMEKAVSNYENIPPDRLKRSGDDLINYYYGPSVTSLRILQAKEKELQESEDYWSNRIKKLEENHAELKTIMERECNKAMDEINSKVPRPVPGTQFPCSDEKNKVLKCYNEHPKQALLCALEVSQFADCVQNKRINSLTSKESSAC